MRRSSRNIYGRSRAGYFWQPGVRSLLPPVSRASPIYASPTAASECGFTLARCCNTVLLRPASRGTNASLGIPATITPQTKAHDLPLYQRVLLLEFGAPQGCGQSGPPHLHYHLSAALIPTSQNPPLALLRKWSLLGNIQQSYERTTDGVLSNANLQVFQLPPVQSF